MDVPERQRTADVLGSGAMRAFSELLLPQHLLLALREAGYERPSPVQVRVLVYEDSWCCAILPVTSSSPESRETDPWSLRVHGCTGHYTVITRGASHIMTKSLLQQLFFAARLAACPGSADPCVFAYAACAVLLCCFPPLLALLP